MKVSSRETLMPTQSAQEALDTEPGPDLPVGLSACLIYGTRGCFPPGFCYGVHLRAQPINCQNPDSYGRVRKNAQKFRKLFEQRPEPSRWQRITLGSPIKWALAGGLCIIAVLLCGDLPPVGLKAVWPR